MVRSTRRGAAVNGCLGRRSRHEPGEAAFDNRIIWIDARPGVRTAIDVVRAEHDFGEALHAAALAGRFNADGFLKTGSELGPMIISPFESVFTAVVNMRSSNGASLWAEES
jgi:hypothetical protein